MFFDGAQSNIAASRHIRQDITGFSVSVTSDIFSYGLFSSASTVYQIKSMLE